MKKRKNRTTTVLLAVMLIAGLGLMLYPSLADLWNKSHSSRVISNYRRSTSDMDEEQHEQLLQEAREYNESLFKGVNPFAMTEDERSRYNELLNIEGSGEMGYIEIPSIRVSLPIYHGTEEDVLQKGVGHLEWSSLPVGGENTHCVLSGHRGLPSAKLFTNLDSLAVGDSFTIHVLSEELNYEVDQILTVLPDETDALRIEKDRDYCTLLTCTPYGINTHRLLVRGRRVDGSDTTDKADTTVNSEKTVEMPVWADAERIAPLTVAAFIVLPAALITIICFLASDMRKNRKR